MTALGSSSFSVPPPHLSGEFPDSGSEGPFQLVFPASFGISQFPLFADLSSLFEYSSRCVGSILPCAKDWGYRGAPERWGAPALIARF